ncbi:MAG: GTP 3',8-cyclase MoaA [Candidatus Omnitrophota bacterium]
MEKNIDYLRLSVTDRCNLNCLYCNPLEKGQFLTHDQVLRYEEMYRLVKICVRWGIRAVRITGGEPLIKKNITRLIRMLKQIKELKELTMTTNGVYLKDTAGELKAAGIDRINVSIDTLQKEKYKAITGADCFEQVWQGIGETLKAGLAPVKLNVVVLKGINDDEVLDFARLTFKYPLSIRFIEFFPTNRRTEELAHYIIGNLEIKKKLITYFGEMRKAAEIKGRGPAEYYQYKDAKGLIGFINSYSKDFCNQCNRVRIDCAGRVSPCLFSGHIYDLRQALRNGKNDYELGMLINNVFEMKAGYNKKTKNNCKIEMSSIGG